MTPYNETIREADIGSRIHIIKRSGTRMEFDPEKIVHAIQKANAEIGLPTEQMPDEDIRRIASNIYNMAAKTNREFSVEEIQDMVEDHLMVSGKTKLARAYITYRYAHNKRRNKSTLDSKIESIINVKNEDVRQENSNKNPTVVSVQRDYMAGEWSRHYTNEYLLDEEIRNAHEEGIIHFHDSDYFAQKEHNCELINLEDMLQNGTKISGTMIETPKSFATCCTITSQIIAQVASMQYGLRKAAVL